MGSKRSVPGRAPAGDDASVPTSWNDPIPRSYKVGATRVASSSAPARKADELSVEPDGNMVPLKVLLRSGNGA